MTFSAYRQVGNMTFSAAVTAVRLLFPAHSTDSPDSGHSSWQASVLSHSGYFIMIRKSKRQQNSRIITFPACAAGGYSEERHLTNNAKFSLSVQSQAYGAHENTPWYPSFCSINYSLPLSKSLLTMRKRTARSRGGVDRSLCDLNRNRLSHPKKDEDCQVGNVVANARKLQKIVNQSSAPVCVGGTALHSARPLRFSMTEKLRILLPTWRWTPPNLSDAGLGEKEMHLFPKGSHLWTARSALGGLPGRLRSNALTQLVRMCLRLEQKQSVCDRNPHACTVHTYTDIHGIVLSQIALLAL